MCKLAGIHILQRPHRVNISAIVQQKRACRIHTSTAHSAKDRTNERQKDERMAAKNGEKREKKSNKPAEKRKI